VAASAPLAAADVVVSTPQGVAAGPAIVGGGFVYAEGRGPRTHFHVVSASGKKRRLPQFPTFPERAEPEDEFGERSFTLVATALDASRAGVAVQVERSFCFTATTGDSDCHRADVEYWVARFRGPARRVLRCRGQSMGDKDVAVTGGLAAVLGCRTGSGRRVELYDITSATRTRTLAAPRGHGGFVALAAAGRYVAAETGGTGARHLVILFDRRTGAELLRVPTSGGPGTFMLQEDGTLVVPPPAADDPQCANWHSPPDPAPHPVPQGPCFGELARDRIVARQPVDDSNARLVLTDLAGSDPIPLAPPKDDTSLGWYGFDFDGVRVVEAVPVCRGEVLFAEHLRTVLRRGPREPEPCQHTEPLGDARNQGP
jgi:hypothetical protein